MYAEQLKRIKNKLNQARSKDSRYKAFGAKTHKYELGPVLSENEVQAFEQEYSIRLPECYRSFLLHIGNGNPKGKGAAAGPYYGIYNLGDGVFDLIDTPEHHLQEAAVIHPSLTDEYWQYLTKLFSDDDMSDEAYERSQGELFAGILPIGSQGSTYVHAIIVSGHNIGKVLNADMDRQKPKFCFEQNFLDWYERWLDEIISGVLLQESPSWFGFTMGGDDTYLLEMFDQAESEDLKIEALQGFHKLILITERSSQKLEQLCSDENIKLRHIAIQLLAKFSYTRSKEYLSHLIDSDDHACLIACQSIFWWHKSTAKMWSQQLIQRLKTVKSEETFRFATYVLKESGVDYSSVLLPFCTHENENIRSNTYFLLGQFQNKNRFVDQFIIGLEDTCPRVVHTTLQALSCVNHPSLLKSYRTIIDRYQTDENRILTNLNYRLKDIGFSNQIDFVEKYDNGNLDVSKPKSTF